MKRFANLSLKNKFMFSILAVILIISGSIAFMARWILVSSLSQELEMRGSAIAHSVAERSGTYVLDKNHAQLLSLIYDEAKLREREHLIDYIFIVDEQNRVLAHTFTKPFPKGLRTDNELEPGKPDSVKLIQVMGMAVYDIAVPINEGIYRIGSVHVGLSKDHIDSLIAKLRITFLGFISAVIVIIILVSQRLAKSITMPMTKLTRMSDEISRGNFDVKLDMDWDKSIEGWDSSKCPAYMNTELPCWHFDEVGEDDSGHYRNCPDCVFYKKSAGDEVAQLADSFRNMIWSIKLYRRRLRESEEKYRSLFASGPDPIFVVDCATAKIIDANPRAEELYGFAKGELKGMNFLKLGPEHNQQCLTYFLEEDEEPTNGSGCVYYPKILHYRKGRKPFFVNMHACPTSYRGKHSIIIAVTDVTEMMEKDAQLIQASKMKSLGEMSAGIAHEINQPLNAIKLGSEFLSMMSEERMEVPPDHLHQVVSEISSQVDRAAEIIDTLRAFGRKADLIKERLDINKPVQGVMHIVRKQFELNNIRVDLDLGEDLPPILAHDNRMQQVLFNLLTNARDAINETGETERTITLRTFARGDKVMARVEDTGAGMPDSIRDKIFEPFFTTKETGQGMGLGLAICYGIIKDYGGEISIESQEGRGTVFTVSFPALI